MDCKIDHKSKVRTHFILTLLKNICKFNSDNNLKFIICFKFVTQ